MKRATPLFLIVLGFAWHGLLLKGQAVSSPPDGAYPGGNTAEGLSTAGRIDMLPPLFRGGSNTQRHSVSATVQRVERETLLILLAGQSTPVVFKWNAKQTKFICNGVVTTADALRPGTEVRIFCGVPLFGEAYIERVEWQDKIHAYRFNVPSNEKEISHGRVSW